ncbi:hypothetical protein [Methanimicrococcus hongohii]|nr:hypothetical protein [Methanimicrococcus sp. Hf6]
MRTFYSSLKKSAKSRFPPLRCVNLKLRFLLLLFPLGSCRPPREPHKLKK